jgi:hypothetical protein
VKILGAGIQVPPGFLASLVANHLYRGPVECASVRRKDVGTALLPRNSIVSAWSFRYSGPWLGGDDTMQASKFTGAQKAFIVKQGEAGIQVAEIGRKAGISQAT